MAWQGNCVTCRVPMWIDSETEATLRRTEQEFFCVHGHTQFFPRGPTEAEKLRARLDEERRRAERAEQRIAQANDEAEHERNRARAYKGQATRLRNRAKAGICPCCNRHFQQLERHIANKHPDFQAEDSSNA